MSEFKQVVGVLALLVVWSPLTTYAADEVASGTTSSAEIGGSGIVTTTVAPNATTPAATPTKSLAVDQNTVKDALKAQQGEGSAEKNIEEVFNRTKTYSLAKKGSFLAVLDTEYSFYRDSRIDIATETGSTLITRFRVEDDAQHTIVNTIGMQYGLRDNLTLGMSIPIVAKADSNADKNVAGLGDVAFSVRWEPFELERKRLPLTLSANLSTKTGDSPYEIQPNKSLSTGKGYYGISGGASTRKFVDPVVLFASGQLGYGLKASDLNQVRGYNGKSQILESLQPGLNFGFALGYAYSLNYDVSLSMSYSQGFSVGNVYYFDNGAQVESGLDSSGSFSTSLGIRVNPKTIVNTTLTLGVTEDAPDVSLGVSLPLDFKGFRKSQ